MHRNFLGDKMPDYQIKVLKNNNTMTNQYFVQNFLVERLNATRVYEYHNQKQREWENYENGY